MKLAVVSLIALASSLLATQVAAPAPAPAVIRAQIESIIAAGRAPSIAVAVARDGRVVWSDAFGLADKTRRTPTTATTPYAVASLTKTFTATALMVLSERGRLALDEPITKYLGSSPRPNVAAPSEVTIRRTLQNVAGFPSHTQWFYADRPERPLPIAETLRCYGVETSKPAERYVYSNLGYGVLGEVIARASGQTYESFLTGEVLQPLGLMSATVARRPDDAARATTLHGTDGQPIPFILSDHPAASDLYINVEDLARFGLFHAGGLQPSRAVIGDASRRAMQEPGIGGYGFGWLVNADWRGRRVIFNSGAKPGVSSALWIVPADRVAVAVIANQIGAPVNQLAGEILASALGLEPEAPAAATPPSQTAPRPPRPPLPQPGPELRGRWQGTITACPSALQFALDVRDTHDLVATLGNNAPQVAQAGAAARGEVSGTLKLESDSSSTFEFDLFVKGDRLEGAVTRRTSLGPRGNSTVTMWASLTRPK